MSDHIPVEWHRVRKKHLYPYLHVLYLHITGKQNQLAASVDNLYINDSKCVGIIPKNVLHGSLGSL